jgi:hypothetical protein
MTGVIRSMDKTAAMIRIGLLAAALAATGCAGAPLPDDALARADFALRRAERAGAGEHAPLELRNARKALERAQGLAREDERIAARRAAELAQAEAELAESLSLADQAERTARQAEENLERMRDQLQRRDMEY